ncbi:MBL fold metallo-hydrolase [Streptomyces mirabilis]
MVVNTDRLGVRFDDLQAVVLSHRHFDHAGGLAGLGDAGVPQQCRCFGFVVLAPHEIGAYALICSIPTALFRKQNDQYRGSGQPQRSVRCRRIVQGPAHPGQRPADGHRVR